MIPLKESKVYPWTFLTYYICLSITFYLNILNFTNINVTMTLKAMVNAMIMGKPNALWAKGIPAVFTFIP